MSTSLEAAHDALPSWSSAPAPRREAILYRAVKLMEERADKLARSITIEEGTCHG